MADTLKEFQQKVRNREFAIDNSWKSDFKKSSNHDGFESQWSKDQEQPSSNLPWDLLNDNLAAADACKYFDGYLPLSSNRKYLGKWIVLAKRIIRKLLKIFLGWYIFPQYQRLSHFNGKVVNAMHLERDILLKTVEQNQQMSQVVSQLESQFIDKLKQSESRLHDMQQQNDSLNNQLHHQEEIVLFGIKKLNEKLDQLSQENAKLYEQKTKMELEIQDLRNELQEVTDGNEQLRVKIKKIENLPTNDDDFYHDFEEKFRGSQDDIRNKQGVYIPIVQEHIGDWSTAKFIDLGSGRGEWLDILRDKGATDYIGIDLNARQNALCAERGHKVLQMDCIEYLKSQPENSVDVISGFQIIEHLCMPDLMELLRQSHRVLKPGGMILFETPNPCNLIVGANTFYIDPSHKRPLDPRMISFFAEWSGFTQVKYVDANSHPNSEKLECSVDLSQEVKDLIKQFNDIKWLLYGPQDYALIGVKE